MEIGRVMVVEFVDVLIDQMGFRDAEHFYECLAEQFIIKNDQVKYNSGVRWFIIDDDKDLSTDSSINKNDSIAFSNLTDSLVKKPLSMSVLFYGNSTRSYKDRKKKNPNPINQTSIQKKERKNFESGHLIASDLFEYIYSPPTDMRENMFFQTSYSNRSIGYGDMLPQRIIECIVEYALNNRNMRESKSVEKFYQVMNISKFSSAYYYRLPSEQHLWYKVSLLYANKENNIASAVYMQCRTSDNVLNFNVLIPNIFCEKKQNSSIIFPKIDYQTGKVFEKKYELK